MPVANHHLNRVRQKLSTIPLTFFLARKGEALRLPAPMESGHTPCFISLPGLDTTTLPATLHLSELPGERR